jgi:integrase
MAKSQIALTNTLVSNLEKHLAQQGRSLDKPREVFDATLDGLLIRRQPSGAKLWYYAFKANGRRSRVALGRFPAITVEAARAAAKPRAAQVALGVDPIVQKRQQLEQVKAERAARRRDKAEKLGHFLEHRYKEWAELHLRAHVHTLACLKADFGPDGADWWDRPMSSLISLDVDRWRRAELKRGIKSSTLNRNWARLRAALRKGVEWGVYAGPVPVVKPLPAGDKRVRFLSPDERPRLFKALQDREGERRAKRERMRAWQRARGQHELPSYPEPGFTDHLLPLIRLLLGTGLRRSEALTLTWGDVDFERRFVGIRGEVAKDKEFRAVPLTDDALEALKLWHAQSAKTDPEDWVFPGVQGERIKRVDKAWGEVLKAAGIADFRLHDCRHDYASRLVQAGVGLYEVSKLLGHADLEMTQRYAHLAHDHLRAAVEKLNQTGKPETAKGGGRGIMRVVA